MKRTTAIFSLILMLITAIQPVIAMHYCGDKLSSFQIYQTNGIQDFCCDNSENHVASISGNSCCETEMVKLSTDEFQTNTEQLSSKTLPLSINIIGFNLVNQLISSEPDTNTLLPTLKFPSKGLYLTDVSILNYICIYRI